MKLFIEVLLVISSFAIIEIYCGSNDYHDCKLPPDSGYDCSEGSSAESTVYYFANLTSGYCEEITPPYRGCGGNSNRFPDPGQCESYCKNQGDANPIDFEQLAKDRTTTIEP